MSNISIVTVPGLGGSGPLHWQTLWEHENPAIRRVEQSDWDRPNLPDWIKSLESTVANAPHPVVLVAHSLAVSLVAHWAQTTQQKIKCALLVAPADVDSPANTPEETRGFSPIPLKPLPFPSLVVASETDPFVAIERARLFAKAWGSGFIHAGALGHINSDSNLGLWPDGKAFLQKLLDESS